MKKIVFVNLILLTCIILFGCGKSNMTAGKLKKLGREKVIESIEDKYDITPRIIRETAIIGKGVTMPGCLPNLFDIGPNGVVEVRFLINEETYSAYVRADEDDAPVFDNYEKDYICQELVEDIEDRLDIECVCYYFEYKDIDSIYLKQREYFVADKYKNPKKFYNACNTWVFIGTLDDIDEDDVYDLAEDYEISKDGAFLHINIVQFDDEDDIDSYDYEKYAYPKYLTDDDNIIDYYIIEKSVNGDIDTVEHM